jgi:hypothetical protein
MKKIFTTKNTKVCTKEHEVEPLCNPSVLFG